MKMPPGKEDTMSLRSVLTRSVTWLRLGYPSAAPEYGYSPLIALMPAAAACDDSRVSGTPSHRA